VRASEFDYHLPPSQIADEPLGRRDQARLFVLGADATADAHRRVCDLPELLPPRALLVVNDTKVLPARLYGRKPTGGRVELLVVEPLPVPPGDARVWWRCLGGASKPIRLGPLALDGEGAPAAEVMRVDGSTVDVAFAVADLIPALERIGEVPLPPYIKRRARPDDRERYQTVYAAHPGAVAAPTAGLHFTPELLGALEARGFRRAHVTLHVGPGTFAPLRSDDVEGVELHGERFVVPPAAARAIAEARAEGAPVIAVGTTVVRTLESAADENGAVRAGAGTTRLFIRPGHRFRAVDGLVTNFHLPRSTLLMLVAALAGRGRILAAYAEAVARGYRFYSYGDAMLIRPEACSQ
jgi:S-adenosylmethionine:tRNA ribosyltransferase-isomerase